MRTSPVVSAILLALAIGGCKPADAPPATTDTAMPAPAQSVSPPASAPVPAPPSTGATLTLTPDGLQTCDKAGKVVTLKWDATAVPDVKGVELWMSNPNKEPQLFGRAPNAGEKQTGAWVRPGATFILKSKVDGTELVRTVINSVPCE